MKYTIDQIMENNVFNRDIIFPLDYYTVKSLYPLNNEALLVPFINYKTNRVSINDKDNLKFLYFKDEVPEEITSKDQMIEVDKSIGSGDIRIYHNSKRSLSSNSSESRSVVIGSQWTLGVKIAEQFKYLMHNIFSKNSFFNRVVRFSTLDNKQIDIPLAVLWINKSENGTHIKLKKRHIELILFFNETDFSFDINKLNPFYNFDSNVSSIIAKLEKRYGQHLILNGLVFKNCLGISKSLDYRNKYMDENISIIEKNIELCKKSIKDNYISDIESFSKCGYTIEDSYMFVGSSCEKITSTEDFNKFLDDHFLEVVPSDVNESIKKVKEYKNLLCECKESLCKVV